MKYRFLGDKDIPDWVLAEVSTLSKISCVRLKLLSRQVITELTGGAVDLKKVQTLVRGIGLSASDVKATLATLNFFLFNASKYDVDAKDFNVELQQLGLPKENSDGIARPYRINRDKLVKFFKATSLQLPRVTASDWAVDLTIASSIASDTNIPSVQMQLHLSHDINSPQPTRPSGAAAPATAGKAPRPASEGEESKGEGSVHVTGEERALNDPFAANLRQPQQAGPGTLGVTLSRDKFRVFHAELKALREAMKQAKEDLL